MEELQGIIVTLSFILVCIMLGEALRRRRKKCRNNRRWGSGFIGGGLPPWFLNDFDL